VGAGHALRPRAQPPKPARQYRQLRAAATCRHACRLAFAPVAGRAGGSGRWRSVRPRLLSPRGARRLFRGPARQTRRPVWRARLRAFRATRVGRRALRAGGRVDFVCERGPGAGERDVRFRHPRHRPPQPALCGPRRADRAGLPAARGTAPQAAARRRAWRLAHRHRRDAGDGVVAGRFHAGARGRGLPLARRRRAPQGDDVVTTGRAAGGGFLLSLS
jgi:hypothetical protein